MTERHPRLKQCAKCDNWVGKTNIVGSCAICMRGKGFSVSCDCGVPGCAACWDGEEVAQVLSSGIRHCSQCNVQIDRLSVDDHCSSCAQNSESLDYTAQVPPPPEKEMRYGWWVSFLLMHKKDYTPILGNCFVAMPFDSVNGVANFDMLAMSAYAQCGESPHTHTSTILNFKRMEDMDFELSIPNLDKNTFHVVEQVKEEENVVNMFGKDKS